MLCNIIVYQVQKLRNCPLASAFSLVITIISVAAILWMLTSNKKEESLKKVSAKEEIAANTNTPFLAAALANAESAANFSNASGGGAK